MRHTRAGRCGLLMSLSIALATALPSATDLRAQDAPEVGSIEFAGAHNIDEGLLRAAIVSSASRCSLFFLCWFGVGENRQYVDEIGLRGDLVRLRMFYYQRGYRQARVSLDTLRSGQDMRVRFIIDEGRPVTVTAIEVKGVDELQELSERARNSLRAALPLRPGQPLNLLLYENARDTLGGRLSNLGYPRAEVLAAYTVPRDSQQVAHVEFEIIPGERARFGEISVAGNRNLSAAVIRRMLTFGTGDYYSYEALLRSQRNLFGLETFQHVALKTDLETAADSIIPVLVEVNESHLRRVRFGIGLSTAEFGNAEGRLTSRNFLGGARRLELRGRVYNLFTEPLQKLGIFETTRYPYDKLSGSVAIDFSQPWFFDPLNTFGAGVYVERRTLPDIFVRDSRGAYISLTRSLGQGESFSIGYRPERTRLNADDELVFCDNFVACQDADIDLLSQSHWLSPLAVSYVRDRANSLFAPSSGYIVRLDAEYAAGLVGSDFRYARLTGEITDYHRLTRGVVLATRLRPGWARSLGEPAEGLGLHPQRRFFGGGPNSVRGFAQFRMGPKLLTVDAAGTLVPETVCTAATVNSGTCDVTPLVQENPNAFEVRPTGGTASLEGNVEVRVPFIGDKLRSVAFVDFGQVWAEAKNARLKDLVVTPGFGLRYFSAIGPVRIDVGYNPQASDQLSVVTTAVCYQDKAPGAPACNRDDITDGPTKELRNISDELVTLGPVSWGGGSFWKRLQFHFSIGQAF